MARHLGDRRHHRGRQPVLAQPVGGPGDPLPDPPQQAAALGLMRILGVVPVVSRHGYSPLSAATAGGTSTGTNYSNLPMTPIVTSFLRELCTSRYTRHRTPPKQ